MRINTALILCAGYGKRLNPLTLVEPKPLLKVNEITLLENCINLIKSLGIKKIILNKIRTIKEKNNPITGIKKRKRLIFFSLFIVTGASINRTTFSYFFF